MSQDANVQKAKGDYLENRIIYKTIGEDVSASVENINDALNRIEEIKANNSLSYSDWSQETIDDYNFAVKQYNESMNDYTKQIEDYETKVNELEETNTLKSRKISDLLLNSASVIDRKQEVQETSVEENIKDLDDIIGGL